MHFAALAIVFAAFFTVAAALPIPVADDATPVDASAQWQEWLARFFPNGVPTGWFDRYSEKGNHTIPFVAVPVPHKSTDGYPVDMPLLPSFKPVKPSSTDAAGEPLFTILPFFGEPEPPSTEEEPRFTIQTIEEPEPTGAAAPPANVAAVPTTVTITPAVASTAAQVPAPSAGLSADAQEYLDGHNAVRAKHGAAPLEWDNKLAALAKDWTSHCQFKHSDGKYGPLGENLAAGAAEFSPADAVTLWVAEGSTYDPKHPTADHFTQAVWKGTTKLGCASSQCEGILDPSFGPATFHSCMYDPAGNYEGQFSANVQA